MPQPPTYKHYLRYWDGANWQYYYLSAPLTMGVTTTPTPLTHAPDGWMDYLIGWQRGWRYMGITRNYSVPIKFLLESAFILRSLLYGNGIQAKCQLYIEILNPADWTYSELCRGDLDFKTFDDQYDHVVVALNEAGFVTNLQARETTRYSYPVASDPDVRYIKIPSIYLSATLEFSVIDNVQVQAFGAGIYPRITYGFTEGTNLWLQMADVAPPTQSWFIRNRTLNTFDVDIETKVRVKIGTPPGNTIDGYFYLYRTVFNTDINGVVTGVSSSTVIYSTGLPHHPGTITEHIIYQTNTITLSPYQQVEYSFEMFDIGGGGSVAEGFTTEFTTGRVRVSFVGETDEAYRPFLPARRLFELFIQSISEDTSLITESSLLSTTLNDEIYFSCGDALRDIRDAVIKLDFKTFFEFFKYDDCASLIYYRNSHTVKLEHISEVFDESQVLDIGEVKECSTMPFTEEMFVNLSIGGPERTLDEVDGKYAVNMTSRFLSPMTATTGDKDMVSTCITEMYEIVLTMQNLSGKETIDADTDNEVFVVHANKDPDGTFTLEPSGTVVDYSDVYKKEIDLTPGANYWEIQNVFKPERLFNVRFTPKRKLKRQGPLLRSLFWFNDGDDIKFIGSTKTKMTSLHMTTLEGSTPDVINEGSDEPISALCDSDEILFLPLIHKITAKDGYDYYSTIDAAPYKYLRFKWLGIERTIFIMDASTSPKNKKEFKVTGLATKLDTPTDLIR